MARSRSFLGIALFSACLLVSTIHAQPNHSFSIGLNSDDRPGSVAERLGVGKSFGMNWGGSKASGPTFRSHVNGAADVTARPAFSAFSSFTKTADSKVTSKQSTSTLNGISASKQVAKSTLPSSTPPPSNVKWIKRFNPYDGSTTTINPRLVTLPGGRVQTEEPYVEPTTPTPSTTTRKPTTTSKWFQTTTTTKRPITTTQRAPVTTYKYPTTTYEPETTTQFYFEDFTTTPRPIFASSSTKTQSTFKPTPTFSTTPFQFKHASPTTSNTAKKPFNVFDFYLKEFKTTKSPSNNPFSFHNRFQPPPPAPPQPIAATPTKSSSFLNSFASSSESPVHTTPFGFASHIPRATVKPVFAPAVSIGQNLEKNVAPPSSSGNSASAKVAFLPSKISVQDSGHKFINRFVFDEADIRVDGQKPQLTKKELEKQVGAPPIKNVKPILSPKISVHVGDTGYPFIKRFVLTAAEKSGSNRVPDQTWFRDANMKKLQTLPTPTKPTFSTAFPTIAATSSSAFATFRPPQKQVQFNNRFGDGVNTFTFKQHSDNLARSLFARSLDQEEPQFHRHNLQLPAFGHFKKITTN